MANRDRECSMRSRGSVAIDGRRLAYEVFDL
jgi:hypothetical protein